MTQPSAVVRSLSRDLQGGAFLHISWPGSYGDSPGWRQLKGTLFSSITCSCLLPGWPRDGFVPLRVRDLPAALKLLIWVEGRQSCGGWNVSSEFQVPGLTDGMEVPCEPMWPRGQAK